MITREDIAKAADAVRKAYETEDVDRAVDLFEAIIDLMPDEEADAKEKATTSPKQKAPSQGGVRGRSVRGSGGGADKAQESGFSEPRSAEDGERPKPESDSDRAGVHDTKEQSEEPSERCVYRPGRPKTGSEVLTQNQRDVLNEVVAAPEGTTPTRIADSLGMGYSSSAKNVLLSLEEKGFVHQEGSGRGSVWKQGRKP